MSKRFQDEVYENDFLEVSCDRDGLTLYVKDAKSYAWFCPSDADAREIANMILEYLDGKADAR